MGFKEEIQKKLKDLPSLPFVVQRVLEEINSRSPSMTKIANIISKDQYLTATLLKISNSAFYGYPRKIETVKQALIIMGFNAVSDLLLNISVMNIFKSSKNEQFDTVAFWEHALATAMTAKIIGKRVGYVPSEELFTPALLHDIGKAVMAIFFSKDYNRLVKIAIEENRWIGSIEEKELDTTHSFIGKMVAERWNLPDKITHTIWRHHYPMREREYKDLVSIVHIADVISWGLKIGSGGGIHPPKLDTEAWKTAGLTSKNLKGLSEEIKSEFYSALSIFNVK